MIAVAKVRINMLMRSLSEPLGTRRRQKVKSKVNQRFVTISLQTSSIQKQLRNVRDKV